MFPRRPISQTPRSSRAVHERHGQSTNGQGVEIRPIPHSTDTRTLLKALFEARTASLRFPLNGTINQGETGYVHYRYSITKQIPCLSLIVAEVDFEDILYPTRGKES